jgi:hypothetical protein
MSAIEVLAELRARGVRITPRPGGKLGIRGPAGVVLEVRDQIKAHKVELLALLHDPCRTSTATSDDDQTQHGIPDIAESQDSESITAAMSLIRTCKEYGVGLRLEPDGTLVVKSNGRAWRSLIRAIEAHVDEVARLIEQKWNPCQA